MSQKKLLLLWKKDTHQSGKTHLVTCDVADIQLAFNFLIDLNTRYPLRLFHETWKESSAEGLFGPRTNLLCLKGQILHLLSSKQDWAIIHLQLPFSQFSFHWVALVHVHFWFDWHDISNGTYEQILNEIRNEQSRYTHYCSVNASKFAQNHQKCECAPFIRVLYGWQIHVNFWFCPRFH